MNPHNHTLDTSVTCEDPLQAFNDALNSYHLTKIKGHYLYVEDWMYLYTDNYKKVDIFKKIDTRECISVPLVNSRLDNAVRIEDLAMEA